MALIGKWKLKGVREIDAKVKVQHAFDWGKSLTPDAYILIIDAETGFVWEPVNMLDRNYAQMKLPYIAGEDPVRVAYYVLEHEHPTLVPDQPIDPAPQALVDWLAARDEAEAARLKAIADAQAAAEEAAEEAAA